MVGDELELDVRERSREAVNVHETDHDGQLSFESDLSTNEFVSRLGSMKDESDDE